MQSASSLPVAHSPPRQAARPQPAGERRLEAGDAVSDLVCLSYPASLARNQRPYK